LQSGFWSTYLVLKPALSVAIWFMEHLSRVGVRIKCCNLDFELISCWSLHQILGPIELNGALENRKSEIHGLIHSSRVQHSMNEKN